VNNKTKKTRNKSSINYTKEIMTCDEVAEYLRVHVSSVRRWSRSGKITAFKVGGRGDWRYREQDVLSFLYDTSREGEGHGEVMVMCMD
jgi:excisionase family DNA binding protein